MGFDLDPLDDVLPEPAAVNARAGAKFQPKAKIRSRKGTSVLVQSTISNATKEKMIRPTTTGSDIMQSLDLIDVAKNGLNDMVGSSLAIPETSKSKDALKDYEGLDGRVSFTEERSLASVSSLSQVFAPGEELCITGAPPLDSNPPCLGSISDDKRDCHPSFGGKLKNYEGSPLVLQLPHESKSSLLLNPSSQFNAEDLGSTDALPPDVSASDGSGDWISTFGKSVGEADTLGFDLEPFDDILPGHATSNVRVGSKFQPKAKPQPRKETSASLTVTLLDVTKEKPVTLASSIESVRPVNVVGDRLADSVCPSTTGMLGPKEPLLEYHGSFSRVTLGDDNRSSVMVKPSVPLDAIDVLHSEVAIADGNGDWSSSHGKSFGENADIFSGLEYLDDFLSRPAPLTESAATKPEPQVNMNALPGNKFLTSYPVCTDAEGQFSPSEAQNLSDFNNKNIEEKPGDQMGEREADVDLAAEFYDPTPDQTYPILSVREDQVGDRNTDIYKNDGDFQIDDRSSQPEVVEAFSDLEALDNLPTLAQHVGENLSRSKLHADKDKNGFDVPHQDTVESGSCLREAHLLPSETGYIDEDSIPAFTAGEVIDFSSVRFSESASTDPPFELSMENENFAENANLGAAASGDVPPAGSGPKILESEDCQSSEVRKRKISTTSGLSQKGLKSSTDDDKSETAKSSRQLRKRMVTHKLVDESEDETLDNEGQPAEPPADSIADEDRNNDDEYQVENSSQKKRAPRKSKKCNAENEKPVRKRKNTNETGETSTKEPSRKFSHTTRRKRRCVDKTLLETPEDEIDPQKLPIRQLILLAEMRERMNKEASSSKAPSADQSADDSYLHEAFDNEWEPGATEHGRESYDDEEIRVQSSDHLVNYQSYMDKTPISRWSKSDTELFYEAVRQFGTDFSMIMQVFPCRSRNQIKLKYKMEERKHPLRLSDALKNRAKDHSHFELVIKQLKQIAAQEEQNSKQESSVGLTTVEEEEVEEATLENNKGAIKSDRKEEGAVEEPVAEDKETDVAELGPEKSDESDDDMYRWSQYKSEL